MAWIRACGGGSPAVPDGRTVTPINDVTIWQQCAGIANPTYTTLAEILADVGALSVLMASDNAVDYLVRCKDWIVGSYVPVMTSDTTPSGECGATSQEPNNPPYYAFDGNTSSYWCCNAGGSAVIGEKIWYHNTHAVHVQKAVFGLRNSTVVSRAREIEVVGSNDGSTWTVLGSKNSNFAIDDNQIVCTDPDKYSYIGLNIADGTDTIYYPYIQFYEENICDNQYAMQYIGQNNYASNTLLGDSDWRDAICNSTYFESVLNVKVPVMTSNTTPSGECFADSTYSSDYVAYKAFDRDDSTRWNSLDATPPHYIGYKFTSKIKIYRVDLKPYTGYIKNFRINASSDGSNYSELYSGTHENSGDMETYVINPDAKYDYWKIDADRGYDNTNSCSVNTLQFYGRADV